MRREIQTCDRCGESAESDADRKVLGLSKIVIGREATYSSYSGTSVYAAIRPWEGEWCAACCTALGVDGILPPNASRKYEPEKAPTLEDMIREVVRQELPQQ